MLKSDNIFKWNQGHLIHKNLSFHYYHFSTAPSYISKPFYQYKNQNSNYQKKVLQNVKIFQKKKWKQQDKTEIKDVSFNYLFNTIIILKVTLKVVSTTLLQVCFLSLKKSPCETKENVLNLTLKTSFFLELIKF